MKTANGVEKPLAEWTLKDVKDYCRSIDFGCEICVMQKHICKYSPETWFLEEKPKFTAQEIEDVKVLSRVLGGKINYISKERNGEVNACYSFQGCTIYLKLDKNSFPSIEIGKHYTFEEIIGDADA